MIFQRMTKNELFYNTRTTVDHIRNVAWAKGFSKALEVHMEKSMLRCRRLLTSAWKMYASDVYNEYNEVKKKTKKKINDSFKVFNISETEEK